MNILCVVSVEVMIDRRWGN